MSITMADLAVLNIIRDYIAENGRSPSIREIMRLRGTGSIGSTWNRIQALSTGGFITYERDTWRSIRLTKAPKTLSVDLGSIERAVYCAAEREGITPEAFMLRAARERLEAFNSRSTSRETSSLRAPSVAAG